MIQNILCYLEQTAEYQKDKIAFRSEDGFLTYGQLLTHSRAIGSFLAARTAPRQPIAVMAKKSECAVAAFMGIVTAGCFYVFLDCSQPPARLKRILDKSNTSILILDQDSEKLCGDLSFGGQVLHLGELMALPEDGGKTGLLQSIRAQALDLDPLYAIFTSGSTGEPKGVLVSHRSVIDFTEHFTGLFGISPADIIGNQAPLDFDVSVKDLYSALKTGATVELIPKKLFSLPTALLDFLCERQITTAIWAVSALCMISGLNGFSYRIPTALRKVLFSGEVMPPRHLKIWMEHLPDTSFINLYGPTEITCNCTYHVIDRNGDLNAPIPIGIPFPNEDVFLLDETDGLILKNNQKGELCVRGTTLALGYYRDPERTARAFVQNPCNTAYPDLIYRTGDLAHYGEDGLFYFDGRKDFQIKHMGHRIELGEIEAALGQIEGIGRAVCLYWEEKQKIVAYYVGEPDKKEISAALTRFLPSYMFPNQYRKLDQLPLTKNGKVDRTCLKQML